MSLFWSAQETVFKALLTKKRVKIPSGYQLITRLTLKLSEVLVTPIYLNFHYKFHMIFVHFIFKHRSFMAYLMGCFFAILHPFYSQGRPELYVRSARRITSGKKIISKKTYPLIYTFQNSFSGRVQI